MANGAIRLTWRDRNWAEQGHYIYRSDTPMDVNNLPSPISEVGINKYEYIDYDVIVDQAYYYRIGAYRNNDVMVSDEIKVTATPSVYTNDIDPFGDKSAVATFNFDGDVLDLNNNVVMNALPYSYSSGKFGNAINVGSVTGGTTLVNGIDTLTGSDFTISVWLNQGGISHDNGYILVQTNGDTSYQDVLLRIWNNTVGTYDNTKMYVSNYNIPINGWTHVCYSYDSSSKQIKMYANGVLDSIHQTNGFTLQNNSVIFGSWDTGDYRYNGLIDQLRIFNRVLVEYEVADLFNEVHTYI